MVYEDCNTEPCPVWTSWDPRISVQCSAPCGGGTIEESSFCILADETQVTTCNGNECTYQCTFAMYYVIHSMNAYKGGSKWAKKIFFKF